MGLSQAVPHGPLAVARYHDRAEPEAAAALHYLGDAVDEKYEIRHWDVKRPDSLREFIALVNRIRRENAALQWNDTLAFHPVDNEEIISYSKVSPDGTNLVLVVAALDPHHRQSGWLQLPLERFGIESDRPYQMHDLLTGARYLWHGPRNYVELDPHHSPVHIFRLRRRVRTEQDFDYFA